MLIECYFILHSYTVVEDYTEPPINPFSSSASAPTTPSPSVTLTATPQPINIIYSNQLGGSPSSSSTSTGPASLSNVNSAPVNPQAVNNQFQGANNSSSSKPSASRKGGVIFPSIKNKPSVANSTFATDLIGLKDVKVRPHCCFDLSRTLASTRCDL